MPVNLRDLPDKLSPPDAPGKVRWLLVVLLCTATGFALTLLFPPFDVPPDSSWFWIRSLLFPLTLGVFLYGLRLLAYENRQAYVNAWNSARADLEQDLIEQGRQAIGIVAMSYCTAGGSERLAVSLRSGSKPLQTVFVPNDSRTMRWSPLVDPQPLAPEEQEQRLRIWLERILAAPDLDLHRLFPGQRVRVRVRHNHVLASKTVLAVCHACAQQRALSVESLNVASDDGLFWLDAWLDQAQAFSLVLSIEIHLFDKPVADQAESVSAVLLARSGFCEERGVAPLAWVHRPVAMSAEADSWREVLLWGGLPDDKLPFAWQAQVPDGLLRELYRSQGRAPANDTCLRLDDTLGAPGCAVGNIALVVGGEQAIADQQPQLLMVQDETAHWCVVRPGQRA